MRAEQHLKPYLRPCFTSRVEDVARVYKDKVAIFGDCRAVTYGELSEDISIISNQLSSISLGQRNIVAIESPSGFDYVAFFLAAAKAGVCIVPIDTRSTEDEIKSIFEDCSPNAYVIFDQNGRLAKVLSESDTVKKVHIGGKTAKCDSFFLETEIHPIEQLEDGDLVVQYSSGSTGNPKGILLTQKSLYAKVFNWASTLEVSDSDVFLNTLTLSTCYGMYMHVLPAIISGASVFMMDIKSVLPTRIAEVIREHKITIFGTLPNMYQMFLRLPDGMIDFSSVRYLVCGGAPLSETTARSFEKRFNRYVNQVYGITEIGLICFNKKPEDSMLLGKATVNMEIKVVDDNGNPCAAGEPGELLARCDSIARGYLNKPEDQAAMFKDGWLHTKDIVQFFDNGIFKMCGRISQFINVSGNKVSPIEVESCLLSHGSVAEAAVVGSRSDTTIEQILAYIVLGPDAEDTDASVLVKHCAKSLAPYKIPSKIFFVKEFPRSPMGKVLKEKLYTLKSEASNQGRI